MLQGTEKSLLMLISRSLNKLKRAGRLKRKKWMTTTNNLNQLCSLEQRMAILIKSVKVI